MSNQETSNFDRFAIVGVDIQNDFCPGGSLAVAEGDTIIPRFNLTAQKVRDMGGLVIFTRDWHPRDSRHFSENGGQWPVHCVAGSEGAMWHNDVIVSPRDFVLHKGMEIDEDAYSGFEARDQKGTKLVEYLEVQDGHRLALFIGGLATDYCVKATALDAARLADQNPDKLTVFGLVDAMRAVNLQPTDGQAALEAMAEAGVQLITAQQAIEIMEDQGV